jgi:ribosomal protein S27AE
MTRNDVVLRLLDGLCVLSGGSSLPHALAEAYDAGYREGGLDAEWASRPPAVSPPPSRPCPKCGAAMTLARISAEQAVDGRARSVWRCGACGVVETRVEGTP